MHEALTDVLSSKRNEHDRGVTFLTPGDAGGDFLPYARLYADAAALSAALARRGLVPGDRLILRLDDNQAFVRAFWACVLGGFVPVPTSRPAGADPDAKTTAETVLPDSLVLRQNWPEADPAGRPPGVLAWAELQAEALAGPSDCPPTPAGPDTVRLIQFSSGSTGEPKGVVISERNIMAGLRACTPARQDQVVNSMLSWLPLSHNLSLIGVHVYSLYRNYGQVLMPPEQFAIAPLRWLQAITTHRPTITFCPNFACQHVLNALRRAGAEALAGLDLSSLHKIINGAEPIDVATAAEFQRVLKPAGLRDHAMVPAYGLTEASLAVATADIYQPLRVLELDRQRVAVGATAADAAAPGKAAFVSVGPPAAGLSVDIRLPDGRAAAPGVIGEIWIGGDAVTTRYVDADGEHSQPAAPDGHLGTGDIGVLADGQLFVLGRKKDIIFVNGKNFYSHDLERVLEAALPVESAVIGETDDATGREAVIVFLAPGSPAGPGAAPEPGPDHAQLAKRASDTLMRTLGVPTSRVVWVPAIPRTRTGKKRRFALKPWLEPAA
ncbi:MAG: AMP-binding protein [Propionibacteriaceae bacterium]|jgi:surfactin family lipopeptide synthetase A|nr:AMP-binding protein [Propionibacteriaceae bacterium]